MSVEKYYKTFSGTDSLVFIVFPYCKPVCLGSITTISYSVFRNKSEVSLIGRINVGGFTRGTRIVAGTMIFTLINQNWVNEVVDQMDWLQDYKNIKADELPIFDLMIVSANEYGASVNAFIYGVDIAEEGQVLSIEDMFTETVCKFIARDIDVFKADTVAGSLVNNRSIIRSVSVDNISSTSNYNTLEIQKRLNDNGYTVNVSGEYDNSTLNTVMKFQEDNNLEPTGYMNTSTLSALYSLNSNEYVCDVKYNVPVYDEPNGEVVRSLKACEVIKNIDEESEWTKVSGGYVRTSAISYIRPYDFSRSDGFSTTKTSIECINGEVYVRVYNILTPMSFKVSGIATFSNGAKEVVSKMMYTTEESSIVISTERIKECFCFSPTVKELPQNVEFIVYPIGYTPIKNIIKIVEETNGY